MDAPSHFLKNVSSIDQIDVDRLVCNALIVRVDKHTDEYITLEATYADFQMIFLTKQLYFLPDGSMKLLEKIFFPIILGFHPNLPNT